MLLNSGTLFLERILLSRQHEAVSILMERYNSPGCLGMILADQMGLGKTLTTIAFIFKVCKTFSGKAVVFYPNSLCQMWKNMFKLWTKGRLLAISDIEIFINSMVPVVLVISYESAATRLSKYCDRDLGLNKFLTNFLKNIIKMIKFNALIINRNFG